MPGKLDGVVPSPQSTLMDETAPSGSKEVNPTVTTDAVGAGLGATLPIVIAGAWSLTVSSVAPEPGPTPLVAVTVIVKV